MRLGKKKQPNISIFLAAGDKRIRKMAQRCQCYIMVFIHTHIPVYCMQCLWLVQIPIPGWSIESKAEEWVLTFKWAGEDVEVKRDFHLQSCQFI